MGGTSEVVEVTVVDGQVRDLGAEPGSGGIAADETILVGREAGADALAELEAGDPVEVSYAPRADFGEVIASVGGGPVLVRDGAVVPSSDPNAHPRTAVGVSEDGSELIMLALEDRMVGARGMTLTELGELMLDLGAHDALNLDGGGSTTMLSREPAVGGRCGCGGTPRC